MKTKSVTLKVLLAMVLTAPWSGYSFYSSSTGRWLSRDPLQEESCQALYAAGDNDTLNHLDHLGLASISIGFGFDTSVKSSRSARRFAQRNMNYLAKKFMECIQLKSTCRCDAGDVPGLTPPAFDPRQDDKPAPQDEYVMLAGDPSYDLANASLSKVRAGSIHVLLTKIRISNWFRERIKGQTLENGVLIDERIATRNTLAHELGHVAGYKGDAADGVHSTDLLNLMHTPSIGGKPDCQWCQKVFTLGK